MKFKNTYIFILFFYCFFIFSINQEVNSADYYLKLANDCKKNGSWDQAILYYKKVLEVKPDNINVLFCIGEILFKQCQFHQAKDIFEKIIQRNKNHIKARMLLADIYLTIGELKKAFAERNFLDEYDIKLGRKKRAERLWDGSSVCGKTIVIIDDIGIGDFFCWLRYAKMFKERGANVIVYVRRFLVPILSLCPYIDTIVSREDPLPSFDFQIGVGQLHHRVNGTIDDIYRFGCYSPYMYADEAVVKKWANQIGENTNFKIGICWGASLYFRGNKPITNPRSMSLNYFYPLGKLEGVSLYSLQQRAGVEQLNVIPKDFKIHVFDNTFDKQDGRFMDTAAVMKNLDLVITVDTSIAHLAGALGIPVWVMLPYKSDWRWFLERSDSPWYTTMRLFRQKRKGDWQSVMQQVIVDLRFLLQVIK